MAQTINRLPKISVIMPVYNSAPYLREAIDSILQQTYGDFEFLIYNDGSTDESHAIISSYNDERINYRSSEHNLGYVHWLNEGLSEARGEYIARMDSDDISSARRFEQQVALLDTRSEIGVCGTWVQPFDNQGKGQVWPYAETDAQLKVDLLFKNPFAHPSVMMRASLFLDHQLTYDPQFCPAEDYHLWSRLQDLTEFYNIQEVLLNYRSHGQQVSRTNTRPGEATLLILEDLFLRSGLCGADPLRSIKRFITDPWDRTTDFLQQAATFYRIMSQANSASHRYEPALLNRALARFFWSQCYFACQVNCNGAGIYQASGFQAYYRPPFKDKFKCLIKRTRRNG